VVGFLAVFWSMALKKRLQMQEESKTAQIKEEEAEEASDSLELRIPSAIANPGVFFQFFFTKETFFGSPSRVIVNTQYSTSSAAFIDLDLFPLQRLQLKRVHRSKIEKKIKIN
jgi:hypothetical protein